MPVTVRSFELMDAAAAAMASDHAARFMAGGTLVMRALNEGEVGISTILRTTDRSFAQIRASGARIEIGGGVTLAQILAQPDLAFLHAAAQAIGGPALRSMATIGGNLLAPPPYGDLATALLALDATVSVKGGLGNREAPLAEFMARRGRGGASGLVAHVSVARPAPGSFRYFKATRVRPKGISVITIAALLPQSGGRVTGARIAYGAMAPTPIRVPAVERALEGRSLDEAGIAAAVAAATEGTSPATDAIASAWYRREVAPIHLRRLLLGR